MCFPGCAIKAGAVVVLSSARVLQHFERVGEVEENNNSSLQIRSQFLRPLLKGVTDFGRSAAIANIKNVPRHIQQTQNVDFQDKEAQSLRKEHDMETQYAQNRKANLEANFKKK